MMYIKAAKAKALISLPSSTTELCHCSSHMLKAGFLMVWPKYLYQNFSAKKYSVESH